MVLDKSGSNILTLDPYAPMTDSPQNRQNLDAESKSKHSTAKKKNQSQQKTHMNINTIVSPQSNMWAKFFVLNLKPEK